VSREPPEREELTYRELTVARVRNGEGTAQTEVLFLESARVYRLLEEQPGFREFLDRLQSAETSGCAVSVGFRSLESDVIEYVRAA
jgi:hypothetical protein